MCGSQATTCGNTFSPSAIWVLGIVFRPPGNVASPFPCLAILPAWGMVISFQTYLSQSAQSPN